MSSTRVNETRVCRRRLVRLVLLTVLAGAEVAAPSGARAQSGHALAEALFQEGKALMEAKDYARACPKLAESFRLDPATGTLMALAMCHEREGKTASAWSEYLNVEAAARRQGRLDRERLARSRAEALAPTLSRLTVVVEQAAPELEVRLDGVVLARAAFGTAVPVDPGVHRVEATAPGAVPWSTTIQVDAGAARASIKVPALRGSAAAPASAASASHSGPGGWAVAPAPPARAASESSSRRTAGIVVACAGAVGLAVGGIYGVRAIDKSRDAKSSCTAGVCTDPQALSLNDQARSAALIADVSIGLGLLALGVGTVLILTSKPRAALPERALRLSPRVGRREAGLTMDVAW